MLQCLRSKFHGLNTVRHMAFTPFTPHSQIFFVFSILCKTLPLIAFLYNIPYIYIYIPYGYYRIFLGVALQFIGLSLLIGSRDRVFDSNSYPPDKTLCAYIFCFPTHRNSLAQARISSHSFLTNRLKCSNRCWT